MNYQQWPDPLFESAYALVQAGRHAEARRTLLLLLQQAPNHVEALVLMGYLSRPAEARRYFLQALQFDAYHAQAQRGLLNIEQRQQRRLTGLLVAGVPFVALAIGLFVFVGLNLFGGINDPQEPTVQALVSSPTPTRRPGNNVPPPTATLFTDSFASPTPIDWLLATPQQFVPPSPIVIAFGPTATTTATLSSETPTTASTPTGTLSETPTATGISTVTSTTAPILVASATPTSTPTNTNVPNPGGNPSTSTPTVTTTNTENSPINPPVATITSSPTATLTMTNTPPSPGNVTASPTTTASPTPAETETATGTATITETPTATPSATSSTTPTATATETPTATPTETSIVETATATPTSTPGYTVIDNSFDVLALVNQTRCANGLTPVIVNPLLNNAATVHSIDMAVNNFVDHVGSNGSTVGERVTDQGYPWLFVGQNIAGGPTSVAAAYGSWSTEYILDPNMREMGLGHVSNPSSSLDHYWTLVMASRGTAPITCADIGL